MTQNAAPAIDLDTLERATVERLLHRHLPGVDVWAYGSRVRWNARPQSDLDLVAFVSPEQRGAVLHLREALEESSLPFSVDLLIWDDLPESFHREIERDYVVLQRGIDQPDGIAEDAWVEVPFADLLAEPVRNGVYKKKEFHGSGVKIVNMGELFAYPRLRDVEMRRVQLSDSEQQRFDVQAGDLLFARRSLVAEGAGKCSVVLEVREPTGFESSIIRGRPDPTKADSLFLYYYFNSPDGLHALDTIRRQVAVAGITGSDLAQLAIPLPTLPEQQSIAHFLGTLDDRIELNRRMNDTLEEMARAIFQDWFVDFGPVRAKLEDQEPYLLPGLWDLFPDRLVDSELGKIPDGWEVKALDEISDYRNGLALQKFQPAENEERLPVVKIAQLRAGKTDGNDWAKASITPDCIIDDGDVIFSWSGSLMVKVWCGGRAALNQHLFKVTSREYPKWFYSRVIESNLSEFQDIAADKATTMGHIKREHLSSTKCVVPNRGMLTAAGHTFSSLLSQQIALELQSRTLAAQRDALLPGLVSGEVQVKTLESLP